MYHRGTPHKQKYKSFGWNGVGVLTCMKKHTDKKDAR